MLRFLILVLIVMSAYFYINRDTIDLNTQLKQFPEQFELFMKNMGDPAKQELLKKKTIAWVDSMQKKYNVTVLDVSEYMQQIQPVSVASDDSDKKLAVVDVPIQWERDLEQGLRKAQMSNRLVMIDFYADWCGWCQKLDQETFADPKVKEMLRFMFICIKVNGDENSAAVTKYHVQGYPNIVFVAPDGRVVHQQPGYLPPDQFVQLLNAVSERAGK